ncbi:MAG TPA: ComEA family DNA-binding protein [Actinomycetota bacterium]|nr:ComEA family DNA-binding protein [Actinomycetota bacterium]
MREISIGRSWTERAELLGGSRRAATLVLAGAAVAAVVVGSIVSRPTPARIAPPVRPEAAPMHLLVHVAGAVRRPGLYRLPEGSRIADAVDAAGGPRRAAHLHALNLAAPVVDGARVEVPWRDREPAEAVSGDAAAAPAAVNVNTADAAALEVIPGIGPVKAAAIVAHREEHGPFRAIDALLEVTGIGPATLEQLRPHVTL